MSQTQTQTDDSIAFEAIVPAADLQEFLEPLSTIADEANIEVRDAEIAAAVPDHSNVAMADVTLSSDAFESYRPGGGDLVLGVKLERLDDVLGFADGDDLVHLQLDQVTRLLEVQINGFEWELALIDPDKVRSAPDSRPDAAFETVVGLEGSDVSDAISATDMTSDHVALRGDAETEAFVLEAQGDLERSSVAFGPEERLDDVDEEIADCESLFSLKYLDEFEDAIDGDDEVVLRIGDDVPLFVEFDLVDGEGEAQFMLAPRLTKD